MNTVIASASGDLIEIERYDVKMKVFEDRQIAVTENITVEFLGYGLTMFYRSLPTDGARYKDITASCEGNDGFSYYVASNPDVDGYIDINCVGNADRGNKWTYTLTYIMEQGADTKENGMILDNPTIFGMMNGKLLGAGDAGAEAVVGLHSLMSMIRTEV